MLRWVVPAARPHHSPRELIEVVISPALRASGWLYGPGTTHHVSDEGGAAWVTVVTRVDAAADVREDLDDLLMSPPTVETTDHVLLSPGTDRYRGALQEVTHVGLDVLAARGTIPLPEYEAFANPSGAAELLVPFLSEMSPTYRRACPNYEGTERFWLAFFGRAPDAELPRPGHWLWNLAG